MKISTSMLATVSALGLMALPRAANATEVVTVPIAVLTILEGSPDTVPLTTDNEQTVNTGGAYPGNITYTLVNTSPSGVSTVSGASSGTITVGGGGNFATVYPTAVPAPSLSATTFVLPTFGADVGASSQDELTYYFEAVSLTGTTGPTTIQVQATGAVFAQTEASDNQHGTASAEFSIGAGAVVDDIASAAFAAGSGFALNFSTHAGAGFINPGAIISPSGSSMTGGFNENGTFTIFYGQIYSVQLNLFTACISAGGCMSSTSIDPIITALAPNTQLVFSSGIGSSSTTAVPEPSAWAMMLTGFAGIGVCLRRRFGLQPRSA